jgi:hypothetical protein
MPRTFAAALVAALALLDPPAARAQDVDQPILGATGPEGWPTELTRRPLTLGAGMAEVTLPLAIGLSTGSAGKPVSTNPSLYLGVNDRWMVGIRQLVGLCLGGASNGCARVYDDVSLDTVLSLTRSPGLELGVGAALNWAPIDPAAFSAEARLILRVSGGPVSLVVAPTLNLGLNDRGSGRVKSAPTRLDLGRTYGLVVVEPAFENKEWLLLPATAQLQLGPIVAVALGASLDGPLDPTFGSYADYFRVPVAAAVVVTPARSVDLGASFTFADLLGKAGTADARSIGLFGAYRW